MMIFLLLAGFSLLTPTQDLLQSLANFFLPLHQACLAHLLPGSAWNASAALICGEKLQDLHVRQNLADSGLLHLLILSQSQILILAALVAGSVRLWIPGRGRPRLLVLFFLSVALSFSAWPASLVRNFLHLLCGEFSRALKFGWQAASLLCISTSLCLWLHPDWWQSLSLVHGAGCAVAMLWGMSLFPRSTFLQLLTCYLLTLPFLWSFGNTNPVSFVVGYFLAPLLLVLWWPMAWLAFIWPRVFTPIWNQFFSFCMEWIEANLNFAGEVSPHTSSAFFLWMLWLFLSVGLWTFQRWKRCR